MQTNNKNKSCYDKCVLRDKRFLSETYFSRDLCQQNFPPSLTFRTFEHKYIDFIKYVWASADGQIKS